MIVNDREGILPECEEQPCPQPEKAVLSDPVKKPAFQSGTVKAGTRITYPSRYQIHHHDNGRPAARRSGMIGSSVLRSRGRNTYRKRPGKCENRETDREQQSTGVVSTARLATLPPRESQETQSRKRTNVTRLQFVSQTGSCRKLPEDQRSSTWGP